MVRKLYTVGVVAGEIGVDEDFGDRRGDVIRRARGCEKLLRDPLQRFG